MIVLRYILKMGSHLEKSM